MKKILAIAGLLLSLASTSTFAGIYLGAGVGVRPMTGEMQQFNVFGIQLNTITLAATEPALDLSAGYDHLFSNHIYVGLDGFYEFVNINQSYVATLPVLNLNLSAGVRVRLSNNFGAKAYLGYSPSDRVIFYGAIGGLFDEVHYSALAQAAGSGVSTSGEHVAAAAEFGLGMLYRLSNNFRLRAEYDYGRYPRENIAIPVTFPVVGAANIQFTPKLALNAVTLSLQYQFSSLVSH